MGTILLPHHSLPNISYLVSYINMMSSSTVPTDPWIVQMKLTSIVLVIVCLLAQSSLIMKPFI